MCAGVIINKAVLQGSKVFDEDSKMRRFDYTIFAISLINISLSFISNELFYDNCDKLIGQRQSIDINQKHLHLRRYCSFEVVRYLLERIRFILLISF